MLCLTRKVNGHGLRIFDTDGRYIAHIQVTRVYGDRAQLGIDADSRFVVMRDELLKGNNAGSGPAALDVRNNNGKASAGAE